jgi:hypothetical protein
MKRSTKENEEKKMNENFPESVHVPTLNFRRKEQCDVLSFGLMRDHASRLSAVTNLFMQQLVSLTVLVE